MNDRCRHVMWTSTEAYICEREKGHDGSHRETGCDEDERLWEMEWFTPPNEWFEA